MRYNRSILIALFTSLILSFLHCPLFEIFFDDKEIFKYTGQAISKGEIPYQDFFDHKPPLIFFINFLGQLIGNWGLWIIDMTLVFFTTIIFFKICTRYKMLYAWLLPCIFNFMIRNHTVSVGIGMTREYTAIFTLLFFCMMLGSSRYKFYILGLLTGLIFFTQQDQVIPLLPFLLYSILTEVINLANLLKRIAVLTAGYLSIVSTILFYFLIKNSLSLLWQDAFVFNFNWYNESMSLLQHLKAIGTALHYTEYDTIFYGTIILAIAALILGSNKSSLLLACIIAVILSFCSEFLSGKLIMGLPVYYYFLPLSVTIPATLFVVYAFTRKLFDFNSAHYLIYSAILSANLIYHMLQYAGNLPTEEKWIKSQAEFKFLKSQGLKDRSLFVFNNSSYIYLYNELNILSPSPWLYHYFWNWYPNWDPDNKKLETIISDLVKYKTTYILDFTVTDTLKYNNNQKFWESFLHNRYTLQNIQPIEVKGRLWKIK